MTTIPRFALIAGLMGITALASHAGVTLAPTITIALDDFRDGLGTDPLQVFVPTTSATTSETLTVPGLVGATRDTTVSHLGGDARVRATISGNTLSFSSDANTHGMLTLEYAFPTPIDFTQAGGHAFLIDVVSSDNPPVAGDFALAAASVGGTLSGPAMTPFVVGAVEVAFSDAAFAGVDFSEVTNVTLTYNVDPEFDGSIQMIGISAPGAAGVPEPSGAVALLTVLVGAMARRRRA